MKLYPSLNANLMIQDFGTSWLIVMEGTRENVDLLFNALFNFGATDDAHYTWDDVKEIGGSFYSTQGRMVKFFENFFENQYYKAGFSESDARKFAALDAPDLTESLYHLHRQPRQQHKHSDSGVFSEPVSFGSYRNENPDDSFTDAVVRHADKVGMSGQDEVKKTRADYIGGRFLDGGGDFGAALTSDVASEVQEMFAAL